jgi:hypothetical protein
MSIYYSDAFEHLLKNEAEKAESMYILHQNSFRKYNKLSMITNIPVIVLSAIIGFMSPITMFDNQNIFLGCLSVVCGIIKTIDSYMDFTKRSQTHYLTGLNYKKISKFIQIQLSLEKSVRVSPNDILKYITTDLENIANSEPCIPKDVIARYNFKYNKYKTSKPAICNGLTNVVINVGAKIVDDIVDNVITTNIDDMAKNTLNGFVENNMDKLDEIIKDKKKDYDYIASFTKDVMLPIKDGLDKVTKDVMLPIKDGLDKVTKDVMLPIKDGLDKVTKDVMLPIKDSLDKVTKVTKDDVLSIDKIVKDGLDKVTKDDVLSIDKIVKNSDYSYKTKKTPLKFIDNPMNKKNKKKQTVTFK